MMKRYDSYKDSGVEWVGEIPISWDVTRVKKHFNERKEKVNDIDFPPLSVTKNGIFPQLDNVSKSDNHNDRKRVCKNDFVINSRSDRKGSSGLSQLDGSVSLINIVLEPKSINPSYSEFLFKSKDFIEEFFRNGKGIHWDLWSTRYSELQNIKIPSPPLPEQQQIVSFLDTKTSLIDSLIEKTQRKIELLKEKRTSLINEVVTKGLNPNVEMKDSGVEWIGEIPNHWEKSCVRYVTQEHRQGYYSSDSYTEEGLRVVRITDLNDDRTISIENSPFYQLSDLEEERFILKSGDFLFPRTGGVGRFGIFNDTIPSIYGSFLIRFRFSEEVVNQFMRYYFDSGVYLNQILSEIHGGVNQNVHVENIKDCKIFYPKKLEQQQIVEYLDEQTQKIDKTISIEEKRIKLLKEYRQSLISEVVTGKLKVTSDE